MKPDDDFGEFERIGVLLARRNDLLSVIAYRGYQEHGRGAVFYCEAWEDALPKAAPFYLPATEPEFADVGDDIHRAVAGYRPGCESVVVVVSRYNEVFVARLRLPTNQQVRLRRMH